MTVLVDRRVLDLPRVFCGSGRNDATLELASPALVAPGQAAVFYDGDEVIGGGVVKPAPR